MTAKAAIAVLSQGTSGGQHQKSRGSSSEFNTEGRSETGRPVAHLTAEMTMLPDTSLTPN
jgi:hypothetical protein